MESRWAFSLVIARRVCLSIGGRFSCYLSSPILFNDLVSPPPLPSVGSLSLPASGMSFEMEGATK